MTKRRSFDKNYLKQEFDKLNSKTKLPLTLFLIGGGAMAFYGLKDATKDIDIILTSIENLKNLKTTLETIGYKEPEPVLITRAYNHMQTNAILENQDGFRWDLFINKVCNALTLSATMKNQLYKGDRLTILITSKEILKEFSEVADDPRIRKYVDQQDIIAFLKIIDTAAKIIKVKSQFRAIKEDPDDDVVLRTAFD